MFYYIEIKGNAEKEVENMWQTTFASYRSEKGYTAVKAMPNTHGMKSYLKEIYSKVGEIIKIDLIKD